MEDTNAPDAAPVPAAEPNNGGPAPMTSGAAGGMTPMSGTENLQGAGGGGVGSAAKSMAKDRAAGPAGGSLSQMPMDDGQ